MDDPEQGDELFHVVRGEGAHTLFVLCNLGTPPLERQLPEALSRAVRLVFVDLRGSGRSPGTPEELTFDLLADDLERLRIRLGVPRVAVFGHSVTSILALEYARRRPATVSHVIGVGTPPFGDMPRLAKEGVAFFEADASDERKRILRENLARLPPGTPPALAVSAQTPMRFFDPRFDDAPLYADAQVSTAFLQHLLGTLIADWNIAAAAPELELPILLAHGRHDYVVPYRLWDDVLPSLPRATLRLFEQSGHQPFLEEPQRFTEEVTTWLAR